MQTSRFPERSAGGPQRLQLRPDKTVVGGHAADVAVQQAVTGMVLWPAPPHASQRPGPELDRALDFAEAVGGGAEPVAIALPAIVQGVGSPRVAEEVIPRWIDVSSLARDRVVPPHQNCPSRACKTYWNGRVASANTCT